MLKFLPGNVEFFWGESTCSTRNWWSGSGDVMCDVMFDWALAVVVHFGKFREFGE